MDKSRRHVWSRLLISFTLCLSLTLVVGWLLGEGSDLAVYARSSQRSLLGPRPAGTDPTANALNVTVDADVSIIFDEPISLTTVTTHSFAVYGSQSPILTGAYSLSNVSRTVTLAPQRAFFPGEVVQATVANATIGMTGEHTVSSGTATPTPTPPHTPTVTPTPTPRAWPTSIYTSTPSPNHRASPPQPSTYYGVVLINGANAPVGTEVRASVDQVHWFGPVSVQEHTGQSWYVLLEVPSGAAQVGGGSEGNTVYFQAGETTASQTGVWHPGDNTRVDLNVTGPTATLTNTPLASKTPTRTLPATVSQTATNTPTPS